MNENFEPSGLQREWQTTFRMINKELRKVIPTIPAMKPSEMLEFMHAVNSCFHNASYAQLVDARLKKEEDKCYNRPWETE